MNKVIKTVLLVLSVIIGNCNEKKVEDFALSVNGHKISKTEIERTVEFIRQSMLKMSPGSALEAVSPEMRKNAARQLVANDLMIEEASRRGMKIDSSKTEGVFNQFKAQFGNEETFKTEIAKMGETEDGIKKQMHQGALIDTMLKTLFSTIDSVDSASMIAYYDENKEKYVGQPRIHVSQIFFPFDSVTSTENGKKDLLQKAQSVHAKVNSGEDFKKLANKYSQGPGSKEGGDIGWFGFNDLRPELAMPLSQLKDGESSDVVTSEMGLHILKRTGTEEGKAASYNEVKDHVNMVLKIKKQNDFLNSFIDSLIVKANVVYGDTSLIPEAKKKISPN